MWTLSRGQVRCPKLGQIFLIFYNFLDPQFRWMASKRELGLPKDFLYKHHANRYQDMIISGYDQEYNKGKI